MRALVLNLLLLGIVNIVEAGKCVLPMVCDGVPAWVIYQESTCKKNYSEDLTSISQTIAKMELTLARLQNDWNSYKEQLESGTTEGPATVKDRISKEKDVDECSTDTHTCHEHATCTNTNDSFNCSCTDGYAGNGTYCEECFIGLGKGYRGTVAVTINQQTCQRWDSQFPHNHTRTNANYPNTGVEGSHNFCRNPDSEPNGPWCYTTNATVRWEFCPVPKCPV